MKKSFIGLILFSLVLVGGAGCDDDGPKADPEPTTPGPVTPVEPGVSSKVRSCELLLDTTETIKIEKIEFAESVEGFAQIRGNRAALAFAAKTDAAR